MGRGVWAGGRMAAKGVDPEKGQPAAVLLREQADAALLEHFQDVVEIILYDLREERHSVHVRMLMELAGKVKSGMEVPAEEYESLAEKLWAAHREQAEAGQPEQ